jgi:hypothetical protein
VNTVARNGIFGGRTHGGRGPAATVDRDRDGVDDRAEDRTLEQRSDDTTQRVVDRDRDGVDDRAETRTMAPVRDREPAAPAAPVAPVTEPKSDVTTRPAYRTAPARASLTATLGLIFGVVGVAAALTGLLAPFGIALGVVGILLAFGGIAAGSRRHVAGRGLGSLGVLFSAAAIVLGVLAMVHTTSWLDSNVDQVAKLRDWINLQLPWMSSW